MEGLKEGSYVIQIDSNDIVGNPRGRYFAILKIISIQVGAISTDELHNEYKRLYNNNKSTNTLKSNKEWGVYLDKISIHARTYHEVTIPDQKNMTYEQWMQINDSYDKSFSRT